MSTTETATNIQGSGYFASLTKKKVTVFVPDNKVPSIKDIDDKKVYEITAEGELTRDYVYDEGKDKVILDEGRQMTTQEKLDLWSLISKTYDMLFTLELALTTNLR